MNRGLGFISPWARGMWRLIMTITSLAVPLASCARDAGEQVDSAHDVRTDAEAAFTSIEPFAASSPSAAVSGFWVALSARNFQQALMSVSEPCLADLGGGDGLEALADDLEQLGMSGLGLVQLDRTDEEAEIHGEALVSFELERLDRDGWQAADSSGSMEDYALPPVQISDQRYSRVEGRWVLDGNCGELEGELSEVNPAR